MAMKLLLRGPSPFGRKCTFAIQHLGLSDRIDIASPDSEDHIRGHNPLAKVPTLLREGEDALFDSRVILEYLDTLADGDKIIPAEATARFAALREAALADGILEAALLITYEGRYRPDQTPYEPWLEFQRGKIARGLTVLAGTAPIIKDLTVGGIGLACALEYMDFRQQYDWRPEFPTLVTWLDDFNHGHPIFAHTRPSD
jgi:glutathione S-transferase